MYCLISIRVVVFNFPSIPHHIWKLIQRLDVFFSLIFCIDIWPPLLYSRLVHICFCFIDIFAKRKNNFVVLFSIQILTIIDLLTFFIINFVFNIIITCCPPVANVINYKNDTKLNRFHSSVICAFVDTFSRLIVIDKCICDAKQFADSPNTERCSPANKISWCTRKSNWPLSASVRIGHWHSLCTWSAQQ